MKLLLDTHVFLWYITANPKLPEAYKSSIQNPNNEVYLSVASIWESVIKSQLGKLPLPEPPAEYLPRQRQAHGISSLAVTEEVMTPLSMLPPLHRDPFDRLIVAQAIHHGLLVATVDPEMMAYSAPVLPTA